MERFVEGIELAALLSLQRFGLAQKERLELVLEARLEEAGRQANAAQFNRFANELAFQHIPQANRTDVCPCIRPDDQHLLIDQSQYRFTNRCTRDAQFITDLFLAEHVTWGKLEANDRRSQQLVHLRSLRQPLIDHAFAEDSTHTHALR
ncbi:hypothetical protein FQZ97_829340 [compost metagenome]